VPAGPGATFDDATFALRDWGVDGRVTPLGGGLINDTFAVDPESGAGARAGSRAGAGAGAGFVLQRVHPVFTPRVHENIDAVTTRLVARGIATPVLVPTTTGALWSVQRDGVWRLMTRMPGVACAAVRSSAQAHAAAALLARFHGALVGLPHAFVGMRVGVHDTAAHLAALMRAVAEHGGHPLHDDVARLADAIAQGAAALPDLTSVPEPVVHGDPKLDNILFAGTDAAGECTPLCLVDLDTVGPGPLHLELGDMWRSWCNLRGEDERQAAFDLGVFEASLLGYASGRTAPGADEREALVYGLEWITLELAARFAADALVERYFGWDPRRFATRGEHNLVRALGQWSLHAQVLATRPQRAAAIRAAW